MWHSRLLAIPVICFCLVASATAGSITGVFQGKIVQLPVAKSKAKWLYIQGRNGAIRRANIAHAVVEYDEDYPKAKRRKAPAESLGQAIEVRVTAEQDETKDGEWQATNVLILSPHRNQQKPNKKPPAVLTPRSAKMQTAGVK